MVVVVDDCRDAKVTRAARSGWAGGWRVSIADDVKALTRYLDDDELLVLMQHDPRLTSFISAQ